MFKSTGKLVYDPSSHVGSTKNWLVLMCDDAISAYYRALFKKDNPYLNGPPNNIIRPVFGSHISVIRGEFIPKYYNWKYNNNEWVEFEYEPGVLDNTKHFWLKVKCPKLERIRMSYGLNPQPKYGFHLTIGVIGE